MAVEISSEMETENIPHCASDIIHSLYSNIWPKSSFREKFNQLSRKPSTELVLKQKGQVINNLQIKTEVYQ